MQLEETIRSELLGLRKHSLGATPGTLNRCSTLLQLLGDGDPSLAYNRLKQALLVMPPSLAVEAASYSLGFASNGSTHLARLDDFGTDRGYEQRHVRRYSDQGIREIAAFLTSEQITDMSPELLLTVLPTPVSTLEMFIRTTHPHVISMREPMVELVTSGGRRHSVESIKRTRIHHEYTLDTLAHVAVRYDQPSPPALTILWIGEVTPHFTVMLRQRDTYPHDWNIQVYGARLQLRRSHMSTITQSQGSK